MGYLPDILIVAACYGIGCLCTGYYLVRVRLGADIRTLGTGSVGARNVGRVLGRRGFVLTLAGDTAKSALAMALALSLGRQSWTAPAALPAVAMGHIWPAQLGFRGGKGMAVTLGALLVFDIRVVLCGVGVFLILYAASRKYMSSGLLAVATLPMITAWIGHGGGWTAALVLLVVILLIAHRSNIRGL